MIKRGLFGLWLFALALAACTQHQSEPAALVVFPESDTVNPGESAEFTAMVLDPLGNPIDTPVIWTSTDTSVASVNSDGLAEAWRPGSAFIVASFGQLADSGFLVVDEPPDSMKLFVHAWMLRTDTNTGFPPTQWLRVIVREDSATGPFVPGARILLISLETGDTVVDTLTSAEPMWITGVNFAPGDSFRFKVLFTGRYGDILRFVVPDYRVRLTQPLPGDTLPSGNIVVKWSVEPAPMARQIDYYPVHDFVGTEPVFTYYTEDIMQPDSGLVPDSVVSQGPGCVAVIGADKREFEEYHLLVPGHRLLIGTVGYSPVEVRP